MFRPLATRDTGWRFGPLRAQVGLSYNCKVRDTIRRHRGRPLHGQRAPRMAQPPSNPSEATGTEEKSNQATPLSLLDRVRANDPAAWGRLVQLYQLLVLAWCVRDGVNATDA